jgi:hypothetical protein
MPDLDDVFVASEPIRSFTFLDGVNLGHLSLLYKLYAPPERAQSFPRETEVPRPSDL